MYLCVLLELHADTTGGSPATKNKEKNQAFLSGFEKQVFPVFLHWGRCRLPGRISEDVVIQSRMNLSET